MLSLLFYLFSVLICTLFLILSVVAFVLCAPFDPARRVVHMLSRIMTMIFIAVPLGWRKRVEGLENFDPQKSYIIVMNHSSMMDIPLLYLLPFNFRWVSKREVFNTPFFGQFLLLHGDIAIERSSGQQAMEQVTREGRKWIERGVSIAIFPEGTRSRSGEIGRFKAGAFNLAREAGVEILPVVIDGSHRMMKDSWRLNWRCDLTLKVLPPVKCDEDDCREVMAKVRGDMVSELADIRSRIKK